MHHLTLILISAVTLVACAQEMGVKSPQDTHDPDGDVASDTQDSTSDSSPSDAKDDADSEINSSPAYEGPKANPIFEGTWSFRTLQTFNHSFNLFLSINYKVIEGTFSDGTRSWLIASIPTHTPSPVLITNEPYAGISWTHDAIDVRWAALGDGLHPDSDAPLYNNRDVIAYQQMTLTDAAAADLAAVVNNIATIRVFGRYYAGGSIANDILDASMAYAFIEQSPNLYDTSRIGAMGFSWGGMMALFGGSLAPEGLKPKVMAVLAPPSDFEDLARWSYKDLASSYPRPYEVETFFSTYWRRGAALFGLPPQDSRIADSTLTLPCDALPHHVLIMHDSWDTLIPIRQTQALAKRCPTRVSPLYWPRLPRLPEEQTLDHGPIAHGFYVTAAVSFLSTYLISALAPPQNDTLYSLGHLSDLRAYFELIGYAKARGEELGDLNERLRELTNSRLLLYTTEGLEPAANLVAQAINLAWGTQYTATHLQQVLESGTFEVMPLTP